jgi:hypothetical protein
MLDFVTGRHSQIATLSLTIVACFGTTIFPSRLGDRPIAETAGEFDFVEGMLLARMRWKPFALIPDDFEVSRTIKGPTKKSSNSEAWRYFMICVSSRLSWSKDDILHRRETNLDFRWASPPIFEFIITHFYFMIKLLQFVVACRFLKDFDDGNSL